MNFQQDLSSNRYAFSDVAKAKQYQERVQQIATQVKQQLPSNSDLLAKVKQFGFQAI
jgi:hypothetical protein